MLNTKCSAVSDCGNSMENVPSSLVLQKAMGLSSLVLSVTDTPSRVMPLLLTTRPPIVCAVVLTQKAVKNISANVFRKCIMKAFICQTLLSDMQ